MVSIEFAEPFLTALFGLITAFFVLRLFTKSAQISEIDDLAMLNISISFSFALIIFLYIKDRFPVRGLIEVSVTVTCFYVGIFFVSKVLNLKKKYLSLPQGLSIASVQDPAATFILGSLFLIMTLGSGFAIVQLGSSSPDSRLVMAENNRLLSAIVSGSSFIFTFLLLTKILVSKRTRLNWLFIPFLMPALLSGSKSALLNFFQNYLISKGISKGKLDSRRELGPILIFGLIGLIFSVAVVAFYFGQIKSAAELVFARLFLTGDVYLISYVTADYRLLFDKYEMLPYFFHPFLRLVGLQGYEYPLGCALFELVTGSNKFGPNPHLGMILLTLTKSNLPLAGSLCFMFGCLVSILKYFSIWILNRQMLPPVWRISLFYCFFLCGTTIFIDIGLFEQQLISVGIVLVLLSVGYELLGGKYSVQKLYYGTRASYDKPVKA